MYHISENFYFFAALTNEEENDGRMKSPPYTAFDGLSTPLIGSNDNARGYHIPPCDPNRQDQEILTLREMHKIYKDTRRNIQIS
jgi:hypothetical protein